MTPGNFSAETKQKFGEPAPDFSLPLLDGIGQRTLHDFVSRKEGAVIVFWSAVCAHCRRYDTFFNSFSQLHPQLGFAAIVSRYGESPAQARYAVKERNLLFPILIDPSGAVAARWHSQQTPRCYLINGERQLIYRGAIDNFKFRADPDYVDYLEPAIASYLSGKPVERVETASFGCAIDSAYYRLPRQL